MTPDKQLAVNNIGMHTWTPNQAQGMWDKAYQFFGGNLGSTHSVQLNDAWQQNLNKYTSFGNMSPEEQADFSMFISNNVSPEQALKISPEGIKGLEAQYQQARVQAGGGLLGSATGNNSLFGWGTDRHGNTTLGGATGFQWLGAGLGAAASLYGMYQGNKQLKLAKQNFEEQRALSRANYTNQAKAFNNTLRNQQSGRSFGGMSGSAKRTLGNEYNSRKAKEQYW